jgi:hypothetical protein
MRNIYHKQSVDVLEAQKQRQQNKQKKQAVYAKVLTVEKIRASAAQTDTERAEEEVRKQEAKAQAEFNKF